MKNYRCITSVQEIQQYVSNAAVVAFDYETAPDEPYRIEEKVALDPAKSHIVGCSFSAKEHTGIYVPVAHKIGRNMDGIVFFDFCKTFSQTKISSKLLTILPLNLQYPVNGISSYSRRCMIPFVQHK